jgi:hypothetical protein
VLTGAKLVVHVPVLARFMTETRKKTKGYVPDNQRSLHVIGLGGGVGHSEAGEKGITT